MNQNEQEILDSTNETETTENTEVDLDLSEDTDGGESVEELKKQVETLKAQKNHWKEKASKVKEDKPTEAKPKREDTSGELSAKDALLLAAAKVEVEDVDEVVDFAKYRKISIADALKSPTLKAIIKDRQEERQTAQATQTRSPRVTPKSSGEELINKARQGQIDENDIDRLTEARMASKLNKR